MKVPLEEKSSIEEIRRRFDQDVERFSNLETGQAATIDAPLVLDLVAQSSTLHLKPGGRILDLGCGAGNFTLRVLQETSPLECDLVDLSVPMLDRARQRVSAGGASAVRTHASDLRDLDFPDDHFDAILAAAVLHHLREDADWENVFAKLHRWLKPGGRLYVADLMLFDDPPIQELMWKRYGDYLSGLGGPEYRDKVFDYIEKEDSPRSLPYQLKLLERTGFTSYEVLHRNSVFACYSGLR
ncbi:MAG: tRNA (Cmo5U34)-methyltransferase, partial [Akkermansiaceae bacterium]|nr:tRNA (Cmo5U34)-methyltransferase [Akkermansiaceae bacterium]